MIIKKVKIRDLRGKTFELELDAMNLIVGPNKSGKTTIADALRFALMGYIPGMNKPPRDWGELLSSDRKVGASVRIVTDIGEFGRSIFPHGDAVKVDPMGPIAEVDLALNTLTLDAAEYFAATGPMRAEILARCSATDINWVDLISDHLKRAYLEPRKASWSDWVNRSLESAKEHKKELGERVKMYTQTVRGLSSMRGMQIPDATQKENELKALFEKKGQRQHALDLLDKQIQAGAKKQKETPEERELSLVEHRLKAAGEYDEKTYQKRFEYNELQLVALKAKKGFLDPEAYAKLSSEHGVALNKRSNFLIAVRDLARELENTQDRFENLRKKHLCPTCGSKGTTFNTALNAKEDEETKRINEQIKTAQAEAKKFVAEAKKLEAKINLARDINAAITEELKTSRDLAEEKRWIDLAQRRKELVKLIESQKTETVDLEAAEQAKYEAECEIDEIQGQINDLTLEVNNIQHAKSQKRQLVEAEEALAKAEKESEAIWQDVKDLEDLRKRFTVMSLAPILEKVKMFTKGIFENDLQLDGSEIGRFVGSKWLPLRQFSGSEQMVATAALTAALAVDGKANYLILDELGTFDDQHLSKFLNNVRTAIGNGVITQFFGFTPPRKFIEPKQMVDPEVKVIII